ncbi:MAG: outer membrane protein assembly factor BamE [Pseudomonadota bacterium]
MRNYLLLVTLWLAGCSGVPLLTPYKIDIQQGNVVSQDMVDKLKLGMSKAQVRYILGSPLIADPFHAERWDYVYLFQKGDGGGEQRKLTVMFEEDKLRTVSGDTAPVVPVASAETQTSHPVAE